MTTAQVYQPSLEQHQPHAAHAARWTPLRHVLTPLLSLYGRAGQSAKPALRLGTVCHSLHRCKVAANSDNGHPAADWVNTRNFTVNVLDANDLNFSSISAGANCGICQTLTGCEGGGLDLNKCLHEVAPVVEASILAHLARITTTVRRKVYIYFGGPIA